MDRIQAINIFLTIVETGSFTATAETLDLSKPMVSRAVAMLEEWFNARLLQRTTRKVSLTEAGEQAVEYCQKIANLTENIEQDFLARSGELSGTLRISAAISFGGSHLVTALQAFMQKHPKVSVQLQLSDQKVDLFDERIDLALRFTDNPDAGLVARKLGTIHSRLVATPAYLAHANVNRKSWKFYRDGQETILELVSLFCVNDTNALLNAIMADGGIAMLPNYMLTEQLKQGRLQPLLTDWQLPIYPLYALYPTRHHLPLTVRALVDFLAEYFAKQNW